MEAFSLHKTHLPLSIEKQGLKSDKNGKWKSEITLRQKGPKSNSLVSLW